MSRLGRTISLFASALTLAAPIGAQTQNPPAWPASPTAPAGAPNIVVILVDDAGFSTTSVFGGPVDTPNFAALAKQGLRYNEFHVNSLCSPTRSALLSGRNNHEVGFGTVAEAASSYPGYNSVWPKNIASVAEVLKDNGYSTAAFGKWHNTPTWQVSPAGPFDRWPTGLGFEHFYGFLAGADNQYFPRLFNDTVPVEPGKTPAQGYHVTTDLTDNAIKWLLGHDAVAPGKPFFVYYATGAVHTPLQVPPEWIAKYKGKFDEGWDKLREETFRKQKELGVIPANAELTPRPEGLPAWDSLTKDQQKLLAHQAEVLAGFGAQTDYEIGRLLKAIQEEGQSNNTLVFEIFGDNGASAEGGLNGTDLADVNGTPASIQQRIAVSDELGSEVFMNHYAAAWAWALSTPFQGTKQDASHLGGTRDPLVITWPGHIAEPGGLRSQFQHVVDIAPTIYEAANIKFPDEVNGQKQVPLEGSSLLYTLNNPNEPSHHHVQYFATSGNRGIYQDGWWAGDRFAWTWEAHNAFNPGKNPDLDQHPWELYNLNEDYSQAHNLAAQNPEKLHELQQLFEQEARRNGAYPLLPEPGVTPSPASGRTRFVYREGVDRLPAKVAPQVVGRPHQIIADLTITDPNVEGVILAQGSRYGGYTLYVKDHHVIYVSNANGHEAGRVVSAKPIEKGDIHVVVDVRPDNASEASKPTRAAAGGTLQFARLQPRPGTVDLSVNDAKQSARFANINGVGNETLDVGSDLGSPVSHDYASPFRFNGTIHTVTIQLE